MKTQQTTKTPFLKPFTRSRNEVLSILEAVVDRRMDCRDWDNFISIPIKGNPDMEAIRVSCEGLEEEEIIGDSGLLYHKPEAKIKILVMITQLKT